VPIYITQTVHVPAALHQNTDFNRRGERQGREKEDKIEGGLEGEGKQRKAGPSLTSSHRKRGASEEGSTRTRQGRADLSDGELYLVKRLN